MKPLFVPLLALGTGLLVSQAGANPYGSQLAASESEFSPDQAETVELSFYLNDMADTVLVEVFGPLPATDTVRTFNLGGLTPGMHSVEWDGKDDDEDLLPGGDDYSFRVITEADGYAAWTNITAGTASFPYTAGIAVIRDMNSPFFGMVGVLNTDPDDSGDFDAEEMGLYLMNGDLSWHGGTPVAAYDAAMNDPAAPWDAEDALSPWKVKAGRDDGMFYVGDWGTEDTTDAVYRYDLVNTAEQVLAPGVGDHGRIITAFTTGTGEDTVLWGLDRDGDDPDRPEVVRWDVGTDTAHTGDGTVVIPSTGWAGDPIIDHGTLWSLRDFTVDDDGNIYVGNRRWGGGDPRYIKFDSDGEPIWSRTGTELAGEGYPADNGDGIYPYGLAYHDGNLYAVDDFIRIVAILDAETGLFVDHFEITDPDAVNGRGIAVDVAGNVYVAEHGANTVSVWSPWGANDFTSTYHSAVTIGEPVTVPDWRAYE